MIDIVHKYRSRQRGFATLTITMVLLLSITLITFYSARSVISSQKEVGSVYRSTQAFDAAQAGLEYGVTYLNDNIGSVDDGAVVSGSLADGSAYTITYQYQGSLNLINIQVSGVSSDASSTRTVNQMVSLVSAVTNVNLPLISRGLVNMSQLSQVRNWSTSPTSTIQAGGSVTLNQLAHTRLGYTVASTSFYTGSDITASDSSLSSMTDSEMDTLYLGQSIESFESEADITYNSSRNRNYNSELDDVTGSTIWISQSSGTAATLSGNTVLGTFSNPVTLVVDGDLNLKGGARINGDVIVTGEITMSGHPRVNGLVYTRSELWAGDGNTFVGWPRIYGSLVSGGRVRLRSLAQVTYVPGNLGASQVSGSVYGRVAGSWRDF